ncbi:hypothetical protein LI951_10700 [Enterococcus sp. BWT-B8]|uniref:hypothetical protein n=1 Tax=Enterococcus sp. BWT-B8 TaxID=2885157 RepID=UPI001E4643D1|nr:hypothetical protein [Enterococcus sp. BWT-B8]MCB5952535.1 hypothetical protein [Enterococcus sp. BWT-B8]
MEDGKDEAGYALLYTLGAILLISMIVGGIFILARTVFFQMERVDSLKKAKDVEEYALQEASSQIKKKLELELSELGAGSSFGTDEIVLRNLVNGWIGDFELSDEGLGSGQQFSYRATFKNSDLSARKILPYVLDTDIGSYGWKQSSTDLAKVTNVELTFPISVEVTENRKGTVTTASAQCEYIYEIQWDEVEVNEEIVALDVWRNVFYSYYLPNSAQTISADEWMRKVDRIYRYQADVQYFDYTSYNNYSSFQFGEMNGQIQDIRDGLFLDFSTGNKTIGQLGFSGSLFLENGVTLKGIGGGQLQTDNLLVLSNAANPSASLLNYLQVDQVVAKIGTYIDFPKEQSRFILESGQFTTSNLLINNTNTVKKANVSSEGVLFSKGNLIVNKVAGAENFSFANYSVEAGRKNPKDNLWTEFLKGSMVIASSSLFAGPINENSSLHSESGDTRTIMVAGNFMLTNAMLSSETGEDGFSYFQEEATFTHPNTPSKVTLDGSATKMIVSGQSFIDSPKTERRQALTENDSASSFNGYYKDKDFWNSISLKNGAVMELDYTGIEPFNLDIQKNSYLSLKTLPDLALFDTSFIEYSVSRSQLNGKLIIQPFNKKDATSLETKMTSAAIPVEVVNTFAEAEAAEDGQVVIVMPVNTSDKEAAQIISRTFDYVGTIDY